MALTEQQILDLRTSLKRCRPETIDAAIRFRTTQDPAEVPLIVYGIIERHLAAEVSQRLATADDHTKLIEDLGIDSLTLLEIVLSIEETIGISIENEELKDIRTLGEVKSFIARKVSGTAPEDTKDKIRLHRYDRSAMGAILPQQPPFFFLDEAEIEEETVRAKYTVRGDEHFLEGHFKDNPVFPASIVFEALGQAACLWVLECAPARLQTPLQSNEVLFASMETAHFHRRAKPGDTLEFEVKLQRLRAPLAIFDGTVKVRGERLAQIEHLVLAFGHEVTEHLEKQEQASHDAAPPGTTPRAAPVPAPETTAATPPPPAAGQPGVAERPVPVNASSLPTR